MASGSEDSSEESTTNTTASKEQEHYLPIANINRLMKTVLPSNGKISREAKETIQECVSEFISFITGEYPYYMGGSDTVLIDD
jgi:nuclear transcription Y subunit beta